MTAAKADICPYDDKFITSRPLRGEVPTRIVALAWRKTYPRKKAIEFMLKAISQCALSGAKK